MTLSKNPLHRGLIVAAALLLGGCGFSLRGYNHPDLPFNRIMIQSGGEVAKASPQSEALLSDTAQSNNALIEELRYLMLSQTGVQIVSKASEAQVVLNILSQRFDRTIVAFNSAGRPREIEVRMRVAFKVNDGYSVEISPPQEISQRRNLSVNENETLSITSAENFMRNDMQRDIAGQIVRRLRAIKLPPL